MNRALAFDELHHLRHRVLRRHRQHHVNVVGHQVPLIRPGTPSVPRACGTPRPDALEAPRTGLSSTLRYEDNVKPAGPCRVIQTFEFVHRASSFRVLGGSRWNLYGGQPTEKSNFYCHPGRAGGPPLVVRSRAASAGDVHGVGSERFFAFEISCRFPCPVLMPKPVL